jgi:hypothetical protein
VASINATLATIAKQVINQKIFFFNIKHAPFTRLYGVLDELIQFKMASNSTRSLAVLQLAGSAFIAKP